MVDEVRPCNREFYPGKTNCTNHLLSHGISDTNKAEWEKQVKLIAEYEATQKATTIQTVIDLTPTDWLPIQFSQGEIETLAAASKFFSFASFEDPWVRSAFLPATTNGESLAAGTVKLWERIYEYEVAQMAARAAIVTLTLDSGTVWDRYLFLVATSPGFALVLRAVGDDDLPDGEQSTENVKDVINEEVRKLRTAGVKVSAALPDNAPSVASAAANSIVWHVRCTSHALQLMAQDHIELHEEVVQHAVTLAALAKDAEEGSPLAICSNPPKLLPQRWNSTHDFLEWVLKYRGAFLEQSIEHAAALKEILQLKESLDAIRLCTQLSQD